MLRGRRYWALWAASWRVAVAQGAVGGEGGVHGGLVGGVQAGFGEGGLAGADGLVVAVEVGELLDELDAAAVAVHVAEAADVHEDVEAEAVAGVEGAEELVVLAAVGGAELEQLVAAGLVERADGSAELAVGVVAVGIEQGGDELDLEMLFVVEQVDDGRGVDLGALHQLLRGLRELRCGWLLVLRSARRA